MNDSSIQSEGESARDALVIAERGASLVATLARLDRLSRRIETIIQNNAEEPAEFRARLEAELRALRSAPGRTILVVAEPIGPRTDRLVRTVVSALPRGARVILAPASPSPYATLALSALVLTVLEFATGASLSVARYEESPRPSSNDVVAPRVTAEASYRGGHGARVAQSSRCRSLSGAPASSGAARRRV